MAHRTKINGVRYFEGQEVNVSSITGAPNFRQPLLCNVDSLIGNEIQLVGKQDGEKLYIRLFANEGYWYPGDVGLNDEIILKPQGLQFAITPTEAY